MKGIRINLSSGSPSPLKKGFWTRTLVMALAIFIASWLFEFFDVTSIFSAVAAALVISLLNAFLKPVLMLISAPLILMSLGLFQLVINAVIVLLASHLVKGFHVNGLLDAVLFSIVVTLIGFLLDLPQRVKRIKDTLTFGEKEEEDGKEVFTDYEEVEDEDATGDTDEENKNKD